MDPSARLLGNRYHLLDHLGFGGMGTVWRAEDTLLGREVAVKEVTFPVGIRAEDAEVLRERTRREARAAARLNHPNAVTVFDVVEEDGRPWLVMELVPSRTLAQAVRADGALPAARTARVGLAVLGALQAAHGKGILHRDVKPSNVLLAPASAGQEERVVLTDFGIATSAGDSTITSSGLLLGSPSYIAPERAAGQVPGPASDLWSLGATLFTAVEGRPPFDGADPLVTVTAVLTAEHAPYALAGPLAPVLDGLLDKDPATRLDAPRARALLQRIADLPDPVVAPATRTTAAGPATMARAGGTAALSLAAVHDEVAERQDDATAVAAGGGPPAPPVRPAARLPDEGARLPAEGARGSDPGPPGAGRGRRRVALAAGALAVATLGAGAVASTRSGTPDSTSAAAPPAASSPPTAGLRPAPTVDSPSTPTPLPAPAPVTAAPSPSPAPTSPPTSASPAPAGVGAVPAGWQAHRGPGGWTAAVPGSYAARTYNGNPEYRDPGTGRTLRVETGQGRADAVADRRRQAAQFASKHPDYREIGIEPATYRGYEAADWEFTYGGMHVLNRVFVVEGKGHSLYFQTREEDFAAARPELEKVFATFQPAQG